MLKEYKGIMRSTKDYTMIFKRTALVIMCCMILMFGACTSDVETISDSDVQIPIYTLPPVEEEIVPAEGGELMFPIPKNPATLNPLKIKNVEIYNLFSLIYEQPVRISDDGTAEPELAETWKVDATGTVWTFYLREGVSWQQGYGEFSADDIIYTISLINTYTTDTSTYAKYNSIIESYTKDDDYTVTITLTEPGNAALYFMTFPVVCKAYCQSKNLDTALPVGTGAYIVTEYDEDVQMTLQANAQWWKRSPYIQKLTAVCYDDHDTELVAFEGNLLDFITTSVLTVDTYEKYNEKESIDYLTLYYDCLVPNTQGDFFSNVNARQAIAYALDKRDIISTALLGHAVATDFPVQPDSYLAGESSNLYEYNIQKAQALLEECGWEDRDNDGMLEAVAGSEIHELLIELLVLLDEDDTYRMDVAENIKSQLLECGIEVVIREEEAQNYQIMLENGNFDIALCSFYLDQNPDVTFMIGTNGSVNYGGFSDTAMDALLLDCKQALDEESMLAAYKAMEDYFIERAPQISLYYRTNALIFEVDINIVGDFMDLNVFTTIHEWYIYTEDTVDEAEEETVTATDEATASPEE